MNQRKFGRTDLHLSELCLSTTKFSWINDEATSLAMLDTYFASGGRFIQSMALPGVSADAPATESTSEDIVGQWHRARGIDRDRLVLATRLALTRPRHGGTIVFTNHIRAACEQSLRRLRSHHIDLLVFDWDERLAPLDDVLEAVDMLIRAGLVRCAVAGGFPSWRVVDSLHRAGARNHPRFEGVQAEYSLMTRSGFEHDTFALCREHRLGFLARSPLAGGFLAKRPISIRELFNLDRSWQSERFGSNLGDAVLTALSDIADQRSTSPAQIALAWVLRHPHVTSAVVAPSSSADLQMLIDAADLKLTADEAATLENASAVQDYRRELRHA